MVARNAKIAKKSNLGSCAWPGLKLDKILMIASIAQSTKQFGFFGNSWQFLAIQF